MKNCTKCKDYGYQKENGQSVCKWGLNFNFDRNAYDPYHAMRCKKYQDASDAPYDPDKFLEPRGA